MDIRNASLTQIFDDGLSLGNVALKHVGRDARSVADGFTQLGRNTGLLNLVGSGVVLPDGVETWFVAFHTCDFGNLGDFSSRLSIDVKTGLNDDEVKSTQHDGWHVHWGIDHTCDRLLSRVGVQGTKGPVVPGVHRREQRCTFRSANFTDDDSVWAHTQA